MEEEYNSRGLLYILQKAKAHRITLDHEGVVVWVNDEHFCLYDSIGIELCCWTLEGLKMSGLVKPDIQVTTKTEAEHVLDLIVERLHKIKEGLKRKSKN